LIFLLKWFSFYSSSSVEAAGSVGAAAVSSEAARPLWSFVWQFVLEQFQLDVHTVSSLCDDTGGAVH